MKNLRFLILFIPRTRANAQDENAGAHVTLPRAEITLQYIRSPWRRTARLKSTWALRNWFVHSTSLNSPFSVNPMSRKYH